MLSESDSRCYHLQQALWRVASLFQVQVTESANYDVPVLRLATCKSVANR